MSKNSTVVIGCKFPTGVTLEIGTLGERGHRAVKLKGANEGTMHSSGIFVPATANGYGRTEVDREFWDKWCAGVGLVGVADHKRNTTQEGATANLVAERKALVAEWKSKGVVFEVGDMESAVVEAHTRTEVKTGFEPLDPNAKYGDPRGPQIERAA